MEFILIAGIIALIVLVALGVLLFLRRRRAGTVRALITPPRDEPQRAPEGDES